LSKVEARFTVIDLLGRLYSEVINGVVTHNLLHSPELASAPACAFVLLGIHDACPQKGEDEDT
jgi:hypothetical protein